MEFGGLRAHRLQSLHFAAQLFDTQSPRFRLRRGLRDIGVHVIQATFVLRLARRLLRVQAYRGERLLNLGLDAAAAGAGVLRKALVVGQVEHFGEAPLPLGRSACGEQVCLTLRQIRRVDECLEVHVQDFADSGVGLPDGVAADGAEGLAFIIGRNLQLKRGSAAAPAGADGVPADDAVELAAGCEVQFYAHIGLPHVYQVGHSERVDSAGAGGSGAGYAPERPGDGVEEGGLAVSVVPAEACDVDAIEA